jgi:acetylornithine aminotransferase
VTLAKGLAGGIPVGAAIGLGRAGTLLGPGNHGTTFGGNPVAAAAALAVIETIERDDLLANATAVGALLRDGLAHRHVTEVRARGLLIGLDLDQPRAAAVVTAARDRGFILNDPTPSRIRIAAPLVLAPAEASDLVTAWPEILSAAYDEPDQEQAR